MNITKVAMAQYIIGVLVVYTINTIIVYILIKMLIMWLVVV